MLCHRLIRAPAITIKKTSQRFIHSNSNNNNTKYKKNYNFWSYYKTQLDKNPLLTKGITCGVLSGLADFLCQTNEHYALQSNNDDKNTSSLYNSDYDWLRLTRFSFLGMIHI